MQIPIFWVVFILSGQLKGQFTFQLSKTHLQLAEQITLTTSYQMSSKNIGRKKVTEYFASMQMRQSLGVSQLICCF